MELYNTCDTDTKIKMKKSGVNFTPRKLPGISFLAKNDLFLMLFTAEISLKQPLRHGDPLQITVETVNSQP